MKRVIKYFLVFYAFFPQLACSATGNDQGNGGNTDAQEVYTILEDVIFNVENMKKTFPEVETSLLRSKLPLVQILFLPKTYLDGVETDALNDGKNTIKINASRWSRLKNYNKMQAILFHELLGLVGIEVNNYQISSRMLHQNRFRVEKQFDCKHVSDRDPTDWGACHISLSYDLSVKAFVVTNANCGFQDGRDYFYDTGTNSYFNEVLCKGTPKTCSEDVLHKDDFGSSRPQLLQFLNMNEVFFRSSFGSALQCKINS